ncbi:nematode resistance protein-like HSPRO2 isoform X2 [Physcomitrium patens]|uniref:Nematode resistance protein-like HSPRO2 n=1 Tax=Physcomitrium patens TaxID=3218 RepID=A0A7I4EYN0_PHYPA|nr:nematode resistance protein-like HSPRO2 isoform X2 [Physcomitrium patens]|eukprot:XP_024387651.1 nematode resistance protein-like HSPRO2 isoform X2 [Physcomitrella patens]
MESNQEADPRKSREGYRDVDPYKLSARNCGGVHCALFPGTPVEISLANCDIEALVQPSPDEVESYELYLHLPELRWLWHTPLCPNWSMEGIVKPALHSLEMVFRLTSSMLQDARPYIARDEWLRKLESLAIMEIELVSHLVEGDKKAPTTAAGSMPSAWQTAGARSSVSRTSQDSLLSKWPNWKGAQNLRMRLLYAIECHMLRAPFTLGLGEPNLAGKPLLEYDRICTPLQVFACRQAAPGHPEDHTLSTVHQILESWLMVAQGLLKAIEERVKAGDSEGAARKCWIVEKVWKLLLATMDLLQVMDPDDFMRLKHELAINTKPQVGINHGFEHIGGGAYCLRSTMLREVTRACKELRHLVPKAVGVEADPKGGPRLQEAIMGLFQTHGMETSGTPSRSGVIHLLQSFQAVEVSVRQFYFSYQQLVVAVMGSGEYKVDVQTEISAAEALSQFYFEPPYFPSLDGAKTFLGSYWHNSPDLEEGVIMRELAAAKTSSTQNGYHKDHHTQGSLHL